HVEPLDDEVLVQPELVLDRRDVLRRRHLARDPVRRGTAGNHDEDQVDHEAHRDEYEDHPEDPADDERDHLACPPHQRSILSFARGSSASRRPSPNTLMDSTVSASMSPAQRLIHGAFASLLSPSAIIVPHEGFGGCTPAPRNERAASVRIVLSMISVNSTSTDEAMFGRSSENMI